MQRLNLSGIVEEMAQLLPSRSISKKALHSSCTLRPATIEADADAGSRQVVMNLITNASDAIGERQGLDDV